MSYKYVRAIVKLNDRTSRWQEVDVSSTPLYQLYQNYLKVYLVVRNSFMDHDEAVDMDTQRPKYSLDSRQVNVWLAALGNTALPTLSKIPTLSEKTTRYGDAWRANYTIEPVPRTAHPESDFPADDKPDLLLTRAGTDYNVFYKHCLVSVNGLFHQTRYSENGVYVTHGAISGRKANRNQVGILSFLDVADLEFVPITADMIHRPFADNKLANSAWINLKRSTEKKTVLLVLGGYLHAMDNNYKIVGDGLVKIDMNRIPLAQRYFDSKGLIDLSSLKLSTSRVNADLVSVDELLGDTALEAYLTLSQSFFVLVDTPELFVERTQLERTQLPGRFVSHTQPRHHLELELGRVGDYWMRTEDGQYVLAVDHNIEPYYQFETTGWQEAHAIDSSRVPAKPWGYGRGFLVAIGRDFQA